VVNDRLRQLTGRSLNEPLRDAAEVARDALSDGEIRQEDLDDQMAYIARYLRQPWEYLETLEVNRLHALSAAANRLVALENGKGKQRPLDQIRKTEENR
jgi:hypothetical protein